MVKIANGSHGLLWGLNLMVSKRSKPNEGITNKTSPRKSDYEVTMIEIFITKFGRTVKILPISV